MDIHVRKKKRIIIGRPNIRQTADGMSVLYAQIEDDGVKKELYFTAPQEYEQFWSVERSNAFVTELFYYAVIKGKDIQWEVPCSRRLIYQLQTYYVPFWADHYEFGHNISLLGPVTEEPEANQGAVGTGISCGVDSLYTVHKYLACVDRKQRLSHLVFTDWFNAPYSEEYKKSFWNNNTKMLQQKAEELRLSFIPMHSNIDEEFSIGKLCDKKCGLIQDAGMHPLKYCALPMALGKLFSIYYFSAGFWASEFAAMKDDAAYHDMFTMPLISGESLTFYSSGMEARRIDKVKTLIDWEWAQNNLEVCGYEDSRFINCGICPKCIRTMSELYVLGGGRGITEICQTFSHGYLSEEDWKEYGVYQGAGSLWTCPRENHMEKIKKSRADTVFHSFLLSFPSDKGGIAA